MGLKAVDIVGVASGEGTRSCTCHAVCGDCVGVNDLVVFKLEVVVSSNGMLEEVMKVHRLVDAQVLCHIGYLPVRLLRLKEQFKDKIAVVVDDYRNCASLSKRSRSARNHGILKAVLIEHLQDYHRSC